MVAQDGSDAVFEIVTVARSTTWPPGRVRLPGLDPARSYVLGPVPPADFYPEAVQVPEWWGKGVRLSGRVLSDVGIQIPAMFPEYLHLIRATALAEGP